MKKRLTGFLLAVSLVLVLAGVSYSQDAVVDSRISQVTVYPDSALIFRVANVKLNVGEQALTFVDIIPELDENSLRVAASDPQGVKILSASVKKEYLKEEAAKAVQELEAKIEGLEDTLKRLETDKQILAEAKQFLDSVRLFSKDQIPKDLVTKMPPATELDSTYKFLDSKLKENYSQAIGLEMKEREANKTLEALRRELDQIRGPQQKIKRSIEVVVEALKPAASELTVSYLVSGASWEPLYDARADFEKSSVELVSHGIVRQSTGEDWENVTMSLSTAKPAVGGAMPDVSSWFIRPYTPPAPVAHKAGGSRMKASYAGVNMMASFDASVSEMGGMGGPDEEAPRYASAEEKGIAVVYTLPKKATIKSDGQDNKLPVSAQVLAAKFKYSSYPRSVLLAYLGSRVTNTPGLQLLGGRVNIFLDGDFVGESYINNVGSGEEFDLYLGADENVKVKRDQILKKVDDTLIAGIPSPTKRTSFQYKLTVENYKSKSASIKLFEAVPVSEDERIKVKIEKVAPEPKEKEWESKKGIWLWELELAPKEKKEIFYTFVVEHPRDMQVEGL